MKETDERLWIILKLADFNLVVGNQKLIMTTQNLEDLEKVLKHYQHVNPDRQYLKEIFGIKVLKRNSQGEVKKWEKTEGFSFWEVIG